MVKDVRRGGADGLVEKSGKKPSRIINSHQTTSYSDARQRLPEKIVLRAFSHSKRLMLELAGLSQHCQQPPPPQERSLQLFDGSTLSMRPNVALAKEYPAASNQHGKGYWLLMRIVAGFCARTGAVLSAAQGSITCGEQQLAWALFAASDAFTIWIGDRNFGVFSIIERALRSAQDVLVRLTDRRVRKLIGEARWRSGQEQRIKWAPSRHDQLAPEADRSSVEGRLIYVRVERPGFRPVDLWLFTTLLDAQLYPVELLVRWYGLRWQAELNFRYAKTNLKMHTLEVTSPEMARKEFYAGLLAYNLVRAAMYAAAGRREAGRASVSFSQARRVVFSYWRELGRNLFVGQTNLQSFLQQVAGGRLPKRRKERPPEPRRIRRKIQGFPLLVGDRALARAKMNQNKS